jgi:hypothetical protein
MPMAGPKSYLAGIRLGLAAIMASIDAGGQPGTVHLDRNKMFVSVAPAALEAVGVRTLAPNAFL